MLANLLLQKNKKAMDFIQYTSKRFGISFKKVLSAAKKDYKQFIEFVRSKAKISNNDIWKIIFMKEAIKTKDKAKNIKEILDVGTENPNFLNIIETNFAASSVQGINIDSGYCHHTKEFEEISNDHRFQFYDGLHIPFENNSFDLVCIFSVIHHIEKAAAVIKELARVSRRFIYIKDVNLETEEEKLFFDVQHDLFEKSGDISPRYYTNNLAFIKKILKLYDFEIVDLKESKKFNKTFFVLFEKL